MTIVGKRGLEISISATAYILFLLAIEESFAVGDLIIKK
jgi:hypothetical protein